MASGRHRYTVPRSVLRAENEELRAEVEHRGTVIRQLEDKLQRLDRQNDQLTCTVVSQATELDQCDAIKTENVWLRGEVTRLKAALDNAIAVRPLPQHEDTVPIDARSVQARFGAGRVIHLGAAHFAGLGPSHTPAADTQPAPAA